MRGVEIRGEAAIFNLGSRRSTRNKEHSVSRHLVLAIEITGNSRFRSFTARTEHKWSTPRLRDLIDWLTKEPKIGSPLIGLCTGAQIKTHITRFPALRLDPARETSQDDRRMLPDIDIAFHDRRWGKWLRRIRDVVFESEGVRGRNHDVVTDCIVQHLSSFTTEPPDTSLACGRRDRHARRRCACATPYQASILA
jgi:hypothetical protein